LANSDAFFSFSAIRVRFAQIRKRGAARRRLAPAHAALQYACALQRCSPRHASAPDHAFGAARRGHPPSHSGWV